MIVEKLKAWNRQDIQMQLVSLSPADMKQYYFSKISELKTHYLSCVSNISERRDRLRNLFALNAMRSSSDYFRDIMSKLEYDFLFEDRFEIYLEDFHLIKLRDARFELIHDSLFSARDSEYAREVIYLGLSDRSKMIRQNAIRAAAYSGHEIFLNKLHYMVEQESCENIREDCLYAIKSIRTKNQHAFIRRVPFEENADSWLIINRWDVKMISTPGLQEHLLAGELLEMRDEALKICAC